MTALVDLRHKTAGRARLGFIDKKKDIAGFSRMASGLSEYENIKEVRINTRTGTMLLLYEGNFEEVIKFGEQKNVFKLVSHSMSRERKTHTFHEACGQLGKVLDRHVRNLSGGCLDLPALGSITFGALAVRQAIRGKFLPAGTTLLFQALGMIEARDVKDIKSQTVSDS